MTLEDREEKEDRRPLVHFTPRKGFMNDPNGLVYSKGIWHLYFQLSDQQMVAGHPEWGHATSRDLTHWTRHGKAIIAPSEKVSIFSGCCVIDSHNTSGLFTETTDLEDRLVAVYTLHADGLETQCIAYSNDGGYTFTPYGDNPILDINCADFRDPKVIWHEPSNQWIMLVAKCRQFQIGFYGSPDLKTWQHLSDFEGGGVRGYQYEMPNLMQVPFDDDPLHKKWVLLLSISPGAPLGGSFTQYFIGDFDGTRFSSLDNYLRTADLGKDWYAAQTWFSSSDDQVYGIGWASNWQYGQKVPARTYRSAMSLPRKFTLREVSLNDVTSSLSLIMRPVLPRISQSNGATSNGSSTSELDGSITINGSDQLRIDSVYNKSMKNSAFEFKLTISSTPSNPAVTSATLIAEISNAQHQSVRLSFIIDEQGMYCSVNRGSSCTGSKWEHPLYEDKVCMWIPKTQVEYDIHVIIDEYICEIFVNEGSYAFTNTFFLEDGSPSRISVSHDGVAAKIFNVYELDG
jgi:beta-fructofuranosidase